MASLVKQHKVTIRYKVNSHVDKNITVSQYISRETHLLNFYDSQFDEGYDKERECGVLFDVVADDSNDLDDTTTSSMLNIEEGRYESDSDSDDE